MAGPGSVQVPPDSTGKVVDMVSLSVAGINVVRQVMAVGGATDNSSAYAELAGGSASTSAVGIVVRPTTATVALAAGGTVSVNGGVAISGTATVAGVVGLTAGTAVIGDLNAISRTVQVAVGTPFILQGISTTVTVAGVVSLTAATTVGINSISATVKAVISGFYPNSAGATNTIQVADSANSALRVNVVAGAAGGVSQIDNSSFTTGAAAFVPVGGIFDDTSPGATSENAAAVARITSARAIHVNLRDAAGNELSAGTATIVGTVSLGAGTANIGFINNISATVQVAIGTPYILQGISTTVQVAVGTPFTIQGISTTVSTVTNITAVSAGVSIAINAISAGVTIGVNSISGTVTTQLVAPAIMSASRGPKCVTASTSANVTLIASPGAGANIRVTMLSMHNASGTFTSLRFGTSASTQTIVVPAASSGGGAVFTFDPPLVLSASEAAVCSVKPNAAYGVFNVHFYVV